MSEDDAVLAGRNVNAVIRRGDTVHRPSGPWTPAVHAFLRHLDAAGFTGAPHALGIDAEGREVVSFVEGAAGGDEALHDTILELARAGEPAFVAMWGTEHSDGALRDAEFLRRHRRVFARALA